VSGIGSLSLLLRQASIGLALPWSSKVKFLIFSNETGAAYWLDFSSRSIIKPNPRAIIAFEENDFNLASSQNKTYLPNQPTE
jgi:hypothetical protein